MHASSLLLRTTLELEAPRERCQRTRCEALAEASANMYRPLFIPVMMMRMKRMLMLMLMRMMKSEMRMMRRRRKKRRRMTLVDCDNMGGGHQRHLKVTIHRHISLCRPDDRCCGHAPQGKLRHIRMTCEHYGISEENLLLLDDEDGNHR